MPINDLFDQTELTLIVRALQVYRRKQEAEAESRKKQGWDTSQQSERIQSLDHIEEKIFEFID